MTLSLDTPVATAASRGLVRLHGADARAFLHRMSTQHCEALAPGESVLNVLPDKQGRCVDLVHQLVLAEDDVLLISGWDTPTRTIEHLDGFLFVEEIELEDATATGGLALLTGQGATDVAERVVSGAGELARWSTAQQGARVVTRTFDHVGDAGAAPAFFVWDRERDTAALLASLEVSTAEGLDDARVAAGIPAVPGEVSDRYNPLELALHDAIHWAKGCYIGQEVISRIDNYGKQARQLVALALEDVTDVQRGADVVNGDKIVGEVTSVASRAQPGVSALAVIKHKGDTAGLTLRVGERAARVVARDAEQLPHD
jgi:folate-binding protein YgfZ